MRESNPWKTLASRVVYQNRWIRVREDDVIRPDGGRGIYGVVELRPSVAIVALNERGEAALAGQWRYTIGRYSWEIPRGGAAPGETDLLAVARRELEEETGLQAREWTRLGAVDLNNGVTTDIEHLYLARGLTAGAPRQDPEEQIVTRWEPLDAAVRMALTGEITEVCSVAALLMAERLLAS